MILISIDHIFSKGASKMGCLMKIVENDIYQYVFEKNAYVYILHILKKLETHFNLTFTVH